MYTSSLSSSIHRDSWSLLDFCVRTLFEIRWEPNKTQLMTWQRRGTCGRRNDGVCSFVVFSFSTGLRLVVFGLPDQKNLHDLLSVIAVRLVGLFVPCLRLVRTRSKFVRARNMPSLGSTQYVSHKMDYHIELETSLEITSNSHIKQTRRSFS